METKLSEWKKEKLGGGEGLSGPQSGRAKKRRIYSEN